MPYLKRVWEVLFEGKSAAWTALFTCALTVFTYILASVSRRANEIAVATQRPYVNFNAINGDVTLTPDGKQISGVRFRVEWTNSGTTPTKTAKGTSSIQPWPTELPNGFGFEDVVKVEPVSFVIGPKATVWHQLPVADSALTDVQNGKSRLFFWGSMVYHDNFAGTPTRLTEFCAEIINVRRAKADPTDPGNPFFWDVVPCRWHNCYDEDCPDYAKRTQ